MSAGEGWLEDDQGTVPALDRTEPVVLPSPASQAGHRFLRLSPYVSLVVGVASFVERSPLRKGPHSDAHIDVFTLLHQAGFTFLGVYNGLWFSKDPALLAQHFGGDDGAAK